jgi:hypothetical protein
MTYEDFEDGTMCSSLYVARDAEEALDYLYRRPHSHAPLLAWYCRTSPGPSTTGAMSCGSSGPTRTLHICLSWS